MTVESASYISQLVPANPDGATAYVSELDDQIQLLKTVLQTQFSNLGEAAVTLTAAQINALINKPAPNPRATNYSVAATDYDALIQVSGVGTVITLPEASTVGAGFRVTVKNYGGSGVLVRRSGSDLIEGSASDRSLDNLEAETYVAVTSGTTGYIITANYP